MARKTSELSEKERLRRQRQAEQQAAKNNPTSGGPNPKGGPPGGHSFGLVARHQKKTGRGS